MEEALLTNTVQEASLFAALSDPTRLRLVKLLCRHDACGPLCVNALAGVLGVTQSAVSQHLRVLRSVGLVRSDRRGYHIHYSVNSEILKKCHESVLDMLNSADNNDQTPCQNNCMNGRK